MGKGSWRITWYVNIIVYLNDADGDKGFDQMIAFGENKIRQHKRRAQMWDDAAAWLFREVYI